MASSSSQGANRDIIHAMQNGGRMKLHCDPESDSLYIDFNAKPGADAQVSADAMVVDFNADGRPVGIDIQHASLNFDLSILETHALPPPQRQAEWRHAIGDQTPTPVTRNSCVSP